MPLTLLELRAEHKAAVIEMGASKQGDIKELVDIACPTYGYITNIGEAHIEGFGSIEGIISTKKELYNFIEENNGEIFCNSDDSLLKKHIPKNSSVYYFGKTNGYITGDLIDLNPFASIQWSYKNYLSPILKTQLIGEYNYYNFLSAICIGKVFNVNNDDINNAISSYQPGNHRSQVIDTNKNRLIVDCYNANPSSTKAALNSFIQLKNKKKLIILGDMLELGKDSTQAHKEIIEFIIKNNLKGYLVGKEYSKIKTSLYKYKSVDQLIDNLKKTSDIHDFVILLKGSRGIQLEKIIESNIF